MRPRWDIDERGEGVADAGWLAPEARALVARMETARWVTEDPEAHLLPHIRRLCEREDVPLELIDAHVDADAALFVDCRFVGDWDAGTANIAAFALLGSIAEPGTFVQQRKSRDGLELAVATGVVSDDGAFATHGHTLVLRVAA